MNYLIHKLTLKLVFDSRCCKGLVREKVIALINRVVIIKRLSRWGKNWHSWTRVAKRCIEIWLWIICDEHVDSCNEFPVLLYTWEGGFHFPTPLVVSVSLLIEDSSAVTRFNCKNPSTFVVVAVYFWREKRPTKRSFLRHLK